MFGATSRENLAMSLDTDLIVDRRRMRRKLTFWRVVAVVVAIAAVVALAMTVRRGDVLTAGGDYVARVKITGLIRNDQERVESLEKLDTLLVVPDQASDLDPCDVVAAGSQHIAAPYRHGERHDRGDRDNDRDHAPERELAPHAAAIDDQVGIER